MFESDATPVACLSSLAVVFAAIWLTNFPVGVIATYTLATLLFIDCVSRRSFRPFLSGAAAISTGFGLAAIVIIPAVWEQKWIDIGNVLDPKYVPWHNFLFTRNNELIMLGFNRTMSFVAIFLIVLAAIAAAVTPRLRHEFPALWCSLAAIAGLSSFAMFPASEILWRHLPELRFVQFPWRWLTPVSVAGAFLAAAAIGQLSRKWPAYLAVVVVFCGVSGNTIYSESWGSNFPQKIAAAVGSGVGYKGLKEYIPSGSKPLELPLDAQLIVAAEQNQPLTNQARIHTELWAPERKVFTVDSPVPLHLSLKLLAYPAWQARINGTPAIAGTEPRTGQMSLDAPRWIQSIRSRVCAHLGPDGRNRRILCNRLGADSPGTVFPFATQIGSSHRSRFNNRFPPNCPITRLATSSV